MTHTHPDPELDWPKLVKSGCQTGLDKIGPFRVCGCQAPSVAQPEHVHGKWKKNGCPEEWVSDVFRPDPPPSLEKRLILVPIFR